MKKFLRERIELFFLVFIIILTITILLSAFFLYSSPKDAITLKGPWKITTPSGKIVNKTAPIDFPGKSSYYEKGLYKLTIDLDFNEEELYRLERPVFVLPYITGNAVRLVLNGETIDQRGDLRSGRSTIWNVSHVFFLDPGDLLSHNELTVEIYGLYETGFTKVPYFFDPGERVPLKLLIMDYYPKAFDAFLGALFFIGLIFILIGIFPRQKIPVRIFLGAAFLLISISLTDFSMIERIFFPYLVYKKIVFCSHFLGIMFFILYVRKIFGGESRAFLLFIVFLYSMLTLFAFFFFGEMTAFRRFYQYAVNTDVILFIYLLYHFIKDRNILKSRMEYRFLLYGGCPALLLVMRDGLCLVLPGGQVFLSHYGMICLFVSAACVVLYEIHHNFTEVLRHRQLVDQLYEETVIDSLTGAHNRKILKPLEESMEGSFSVILFDLNRFKDINDTYGHSVGDLVLKEFTRIVKDQIRNNDYVLRIGGDEFVAILPGCSESTAFKHGDYILKKLEQNFLEYQGKKIRFSSAFGVGSSDGNTLLGDVISEADRKMYLHKELHR